MLETIEKLLILQDRDQKLRRVRGELAHIEPERQTLKAKAANAQAELEKAKLRAKEIESSRKDLELEVEGQEAADRQLRQPAVPDAQERGIPRLGPRD